MEKGKSNNGSAHNNQLVKNLSECGGCDPEIPTAGDDFTEISCAINKLNIRFCIATCTNGGTVFSKRKFKMKCRCPRQVNNSYEDTGNLFRG